MNETILTAQARLKIIKEECRILLPEGPVGSVQRENVRWLLKALERVQRTLRCCQRELRYNPGDSNKEGDALVDAAYEDAEDSLRDTGWDVRDERTEHD